MRIGFLITARLKSSRLPFKVLRHLNGKTVIEHIIDRAKYIQGIDDIVLCTSINPQDRPLVDIAQKEGVFYFNGDEKDVLKRLHDAGKFFNLDYFVGITADNPLFSIEYSNFIVDVLKTNQNDLVKIKGLPFGSATYGLKVSTLEIICQIKEEVDTEIWGPLINRPDIFDVKEIEAEKHLNKPEWRFTLDYYEDLKFLENIFNNLEHNKSLSLSSVIEWLENNLEILRLNENCVQKNISPDIQHRIDEFFSKNKQKIVKAKNKINEPE